MNCEPLEAFKIAIILGITNGNELNWLFDGLGIKRRSRINPDIDLNQHTNNSDATKKQNNVNNNFPTKNHNSTEPTLIPIKPENKEALQYEEVRDLTRSDLEHVNKIEPATLRRNISSEIPPTFLLEARWIRAIFTELLSEWYHTNNIDTRALIKNYTRTGLINEIPFQIQRSIQRGVDVLIDQSNSMGPFSYDVKNIIEHLRKFLGKSSLHIDWLLIDKGEIVIGKQFRTPNYQRQIGYKAPILLITDFGIGASLTRDDEWSWSIWEKFLMQACHPAAQLVALIPASASLWPEDLYKVASMALEWECYTTPTTAARENRRLAKSRRYLRHE